MQQPIFIHEQIMVHIKTNGGKKMSTYGYARISSMMQNEDRQFVALKTAGVAEKNIFLDKQSGKDFERPQYQKMMKKYLDA